MTADPEVGKNYDGKVVRLVDFGAFVEILPGIQGLLHISQIDNKRINKVSDVLKEGDIVRVKLLSIEGNKYSLSRKVLLKEKEEETSETSEATEE
jgi:polyribonucleotide nucleotidyltransferase